MDAYKRPVMFIGGLILLALSIFRPGCVPDRLLPTGQRVAESPSTEQTSTEQTPAAADQNPSDLIIGSFNIQTLGRSKISKPEIVEILVDIVHRFDVLAIQELRDTHQTVIPRFLEAINRGGYQYRAVVSRPLGYVDSVSKRAYKEQLVYVYDASRIELIGTPYVAQDRYQIMHRPPYVAQFRSRMLPPQQAFSFTLINVHTDPNDTLVEFEAMQEIIGSLFSNHPGEDDFLILGDFNNTPYQFQKYRWLSNQFAAIPGQWKTNTRQSKSYDNIVFDAGRTAEFKNQSGVVNLMQTYRLSEPQALRVSDHMPVWARFSPNESTSELLTQEPQTIR